MKTAKIGWTSEPEFETASYGSLFMQQLKDIMEHDIPFKDKFMEVRALISEYTK